MLPLTTDIHDEMRLLVRAVTAMKSRAQFVVAFGGITADGRAPLSSYAGTVGTSVHGLVIEPCEGLGGQALQTRKPVSAIDYQRTRSITRRYEREVNAEGIVTLMAIPVLVDGEVRAVLYGGHRVATQLGNDTVSSAMKIARNLSWEMSVHDEVKRRAEAAQGERVTGIAPSADTSSRVREIREQYAELRAIAQSIDDAELRLRIEQVGTVLIGRPERRDEALPRLTPREVDVLAIVALGQRNAQVAHRLDLEESTVKAYLASAMRKLGASSRFDAVLKARSIHAIP
jgi:DNA-binding NarL/FixJ family response regulator